MFVGSWAASHKHFEVGSAAALYFKELALLFVPLPETLARICLQMNEYSFCAGEISAIQLKRDE